MDGTMANVVCVIILAAVIGLAVFYIYRQKKKGKKCIGCSSGGECEKHKMKDCCK